jgi:hypothetical protein
MNSCIFTGDVTMRLVSVHAFSNATWTVRLAFLIVAVQQGTASLAEAKDDVPIKGTIQAVESSDVQFPTLFVEGSGSGNATHLGHYTVTYEFEVDIPTLTGIGTFHFIAANGDSLFTDVTGQAFPTDDPDVLFGVTMHTVVGGTGRFDGATGEFIEIVLVNAVTGVRSGSLDGTINK